MQLRIVTLGFLQQDHKLLKIRTEVSQASQMGLQAHRGILN